MVLNITFINNYIYLKDALICMFSLIMIILLANQETINVKLQIRKNMLELKLFYLSRNKTWYMHCNFAISQFRGGLGLGG